MNRLEKALRSERSVALLAAFLSAGLIVSARGIGLLEPIELAVYDRLLAARPAPDDPGARVIVVGYTEEDVQQQAVYPVPDETMAELLETILSYGPRGIGVDFYRDILIPPGSARFEALLRGDPRLIMVYLKPDVGKAGVPPPKVLVGSQQIGLADQMHDSDDIVRRALLYLDDDDGSLHFSLGLRLALLYLAPEGAKLGTDPEHPDWIRLGSTPLPRLRASDGGYAAADERGYRGYQLLIDFDGTAPFRLVSMGDVLEGRVGADDFRDKMVFFGATAESTPDLRRSPFGFWPGIFIHAHVAAQLVRYGLGEDEPLRSWSNPAEAAWIILWCLLGAALGLRRGSLGVLIAATLTGAVVIGLVGWGALASGTWIPVAPPLGGWLLSAAGVTAYISRRESADRKVMMQLFSRHVSRTVARDIWEHRDQFLEGGRPRPQRQHVTVLFVDVKSFTPLAEGLEPLILMDWVNDLMSVLAQEVEDHGGFVDDYFGDGMKADFGVPVPHETQEEWCADVIAAVRCAIAMEEKLAYLNASWEERDMPTGRLRVGIDSGYAVVGNVGSSDRMKYTVLGDTANTAARLESLDDSAHDFERKPVRVLVSHRSRALMGDLFETFDHGEISLKGKTQKIRTFEVLDSRHPAARAERPATAKLS